LIASNVVLNATPASAPTLINEEVIWEFSILIFFKVAPSV
jgi:hypothetical protein